MPKFCPQCGSQISDDSAFCANCGTKFEEVASINNASYEAQPVDSYSVDQGAIYEAPNKSAKRNKIIGIAAVAIVLIVVIGIVISLFTGGYKGAVKAYMKAIETCDYDDIEDAMPEVMIDAMLEEYDGDKDKVEKLWKSEWDEVSSVDYDIVDSEKFNKDQLDGLKKYLEGAFEDSVDEKIKVSKAYEVKTKVKFESKDGDEEADTFYFIVAKVNGDWGVIFTDESSMIDEFDD